MAVPLRRRRVDHSCSRIVWWSSTRAWRTDDLPEALEPESKVSGPRGSRNSSKHLKCWRSSRVSIEHLPEHFLGHREPVLDLLHVVGRVGDRLVELIVGQQGVESGPQSVHTGLNQILWIARETGGHDIPKRGVERAAAVLARDMFSECVLAEDFVVIGHAGLELR